MKLTFYGKQFAKMAMQNLYLPRLYKKIWKKNPQIQKGLILFADNHTASGSVPFSMQHIYKILTKDPRYTVKKCITDFSKMNHRSILNWIKTFLALYAKAEYVFLCSNFLPVAACAKRPETTVVQLWHSGGLLKKCGYDTEEDIPKGYRGEVYKNYDLFTVSAPCCVPVLSNATHQPKGVVQAVGVSRTDIYFDQNWNKTNLDTFFQTYPQAKGKKVILWAPTFRGNAAMPSLCGMETIRQVMKQTSDRYFWIIKLHPHLEGKGMRSNCTIPCEKLFHVTDLLITDYSSTLLDYLTYQKPFVLFAPDLDEYERKRGFYVPYDSFPTTIAKTEEDLANAIEQELYHRSKEDLKQCYQYHMKYCDGHATERILQMLHL